MLQGTIIAIEPTTGICTIQPDNGSENAYFMNDEVDDVFSPRDVVTFDITNERRASTAPGVKAVNIKIVK